MHTYTHTFKVNVYPGRIKTPLGPRTFQPAPFDRPLSAGAEPTFSQFSCVCACRHMH